METKALAKRMVLPDDNLGEFHEEGMPKRTKPILFKKSYKRATDTSAAIMHEFSRARPDEFSTGVEGLHGCTTMYIISRKAVYITHWWENVAFDADMLELTVFDLLRNGGKYYHKLDASIIEDDYIHAYMIHPTQAFRQLKDPSQSDYTDQWNQIRTVVGELVPKLQDQSRWTDVPYIRVPVDKDLDEENMVRGKNLFKYNRAQSIGGGQTQQWAMMYHEPPALLPARGFKLNKFSPTSITQYQGELSQLSCTIAPEYNSFIRAFHSACSASDLLKVQETLGCQRLLKIADLSMGLALATHRAHTDLVDVLFDTDARVAQMANNYLPGDCKIQQDPRISIH
ncbi:hypothetical protein BDV25DRAFT_139695 [Aspergillus avenaceus]|uniref:Uncharacterized protein n=1 Tax=Aspergillus avenaceus TaxID=36643 RepID=A0A5N6TX17_ASPAV|nr:hypothetical protein BDV25DRAFT_139695 [Aspergillus avenaceus]